MNDLDRKLRLPFVRMFLQGRDPGSIVLEAQENLAVILARTKDAIVCLQAANLTGDR